MRASLRARALWASERPGPSPSPASGAAPAPRRAPLLRTLGPWLLLASLLGLAPASAAGGQSNAPLPAATARTEPELAATVRIEDPASECVRVTLELSGLAGPTRLEFPSGHSFVVLEPRFAELPVLEEPAPGASLERSSSFAFRLDPGAGSSARLRYTLRLDQRRQPEVQGRDEYEQPYLAEDHGLLVSAALLMAPRSVRPTGVRFELPAGWGIECPWPEIEPGRFLPAAGQALQHDLIAIGAWTVQRQQVAGVDLSVAFAPGQERLAALLVRDLGRIVARELELFGSRPHDRYLLLFGRADQPGAFYGSPKRASMTLSVGADLPPEAFADGLCHLVAHEYHHTWMQARCQPRDELRFLAEGFTDWYAYRLTQELGLLTPEGLRQAFLERLAAAEGALARWEGSLSAAGGPEFFRGGAAYDACYAGGLCLAVLLERALPRAAQESGLDGLMRAFYEDPRWRDGTRPALADWLALLAQQLGPDGAGLLGAIEQALVAPAEVDWAGLFARTGLTLERRVEALEPSPRARFEGTRVTVLDPAGAAAAIGLTPGDRVLEVQGQAVSDEAGLRRAWAPDLEGRLQVRFERGGESQVFSGAYPSRAVWSCSAAKPWIAG
jgi:predicted metalloprotease with PDZ domain